MIRPELDRLPAHGSCARGIVLHKGLLLIMRRSKPGQPDYVVLPGGHIEPGENSPDAAAREIPEETTVQVANPRLVFIESAVPGKWGRQDIYLFDYVSGEPRLPEDSMEYELQSNGGGTFEPGWVKVSEFENYMSIFKSPWLASALATAFRDGFPDEPIHLNNSSV